MSELQLPPSVRDLRATAIEAITNRQAQIDLSPLLVYRIASTPATALPFLAWHFDVLNPLYQLLSPGVDQRQLIAQAISLKQKMGTPRAIKTALKNLGWANATILEGQNSWGGSSWPSNQGWAVCRILIPLNGSLGTGPPAPSDVWRPDIFYAAGAIVTFNGNTFISSGPTLAGRVPQFADFNDVPDDALLGDFDTLVQLPWAMMAVSSSLLESTVPAAGPAVALIEAAFYFFAPERCWLDSVWFTMPPWSDAAPVPTDSFTIGGIAEIGTDAAPAPAEGALVISITMGAMADLYPPIAPLQNNHYPQKGHNQGANEPLVSDGPLVINGVIHGESS